MVCRGVHNYLKRSNNLIGGGSIPIFLKVYGSNLQLLVAENTSVTDLYNVAAAWMNVDPGSIRIEVCKMGVLREGMGHILIGSKFILLLKGLKLQILIYL
jgi:hypothetical protein